MGETGDRQKGRAPALFLFALFCGITVVLTSAHYLSHGGKFHIYFILLYAWETIMFSLSIVAMAVFAYSRNKHTYVGDTSSSLLNVDDDLDINEFPVRSNHLDGKMKRPWWTHFPLSSFVFGICCLGSVILPVFETYRTIFNLSCFENTSKQLMAMLILKCGKNLTCILFCVVQLVFALTFKRKYANTLMMKSCLSVVMACNITLCVNVVLNIIWTSNTIETLFTNNSSDVTNELLEEWVYLKCTNHTADVDQTILYFYKYSYQFPIEYALFAICILCGIWNVMSLSKLSTATLQTRERTRAVSETSRETVDTNSSNILSIEESERTHLLRKSISRRCKYIRSAIKPTAVFVARHAFFPTTVLVLGVFTCQLYTEIKTAIQEDNVRSLIYYNQNISYSSMHEFYSMLQTIYTYVLCIVAFVGFMLALNVTTTKSFNDPRSILLVVGATGHLVLILFETIDSIEQFFEDNSKKAEKVVFLVKIILHYLGLYSQTVLVLKSRKIKINRSSMASGKQLFIKAAIVFIGLCNTERWAADSFMSPTVLIHIDEIHDEDPNDRKVWWFLTQFLYPLVIVYRLLSAVLCFEACVRFNHETSQESHLQSASAD